MSTDAPDRPPVVTLLRELDVPRHAKRGIAVGVALAAGLYVVRVFELLGPFRGTREYPVLGPEGWFLLLAVVLAVATAMLVTTALAVVTAIRLARRTQ